MIIIVITGHFLSYKKSQEKSRANIVWPMAWELVGLRMGDSQILLLINADNCALIVSLIHAHTHTLTGTNTITSTHTLWQ